MVEINPTSTPEDILNDPKREEASTHVEAVSLESSNGVETYGIGRTNTQQSTQFDQAYSKAPIVAVSQVNDSKQKRSKLTFILILVYIIAVGISVVQLL
jgi:hypothetical protein